MKKLTLTTFVIAILTTMAFSKNLTQTVRGTLIDYDSKLPLIGAAIMVPGSNPIIGTTTDVNGNFRLDNIPIGRVTLQLMYLGYETKTFSNIIVNSGKEVVLDLSMQESVVKMDEVVVKANKNKGEALNSMALLSARSISPEETKRFAGGFDDPSRVVSNFAGVSYTPDGSSDIIVRGNSPKYLQWRLEGIEIPSPYHFDDQNASFGGLSALNNNLLASSDFFTGAFSPEYGNVLSSVMDVKLRNGNNEKLESTFGLGLLGTDITLEGPIKKGYAGSFLVNYRYSTATLLIESGLIEFDGTPNYQDATFKFNLPTKNAGTFSIFGLAGLSNMKVKNLSPDVIASPNGKAAESDIKTEYNKNNYLLNAGINHVYTINNNSFIKTTLLYSGNGISDDIYKSKIVKVDNSEGDYLTDSLINRKHDFANLIDRTIYRGALTYSNKLNAKNKIQIGTKYSYYNYNYDQSILLNDTSAMFNVVDFAGSAGAITNFMSWKHRLTEDITLVAGVYNNNVLLNNKYTIEPRLAFNWKINKTSSFHAGYGNHSTMESIHHYFTKVEGDDGNISQPNKNLGLLKAHHYVVGYENRFTKNLMAKVELYYQDLYNLPVENNDTSYFATINEGIDYRYVDLVNKGTGKNYGVELTLERFFDKNYFFLVNTSLFNSTYKSLEGIERNTRYNNNFLCNILVGKEFTKLGAKKNKTLAVNGKIFFGGSQKYIPLLRDNQGNLNVNPETNEYWDYSKAFDKSLDKMYTINLSLSYKVNRPRATHEIFLDLQNLSDYRGRIYEFYDENEPNSIGYLKQMQFIPNLMYRVYF
ncbi:MAG: TonB-dependent receptor [Salinivirgaceae bacterium]|jgi:hypothetical protein|nr:TonB-dependent receptor [Salinivirgaceae bacterium]